MPGIPITFAPKFHAEAKAKGTIKHPDPGSLPAFLIYYQARIKLLACLFKSQAMPKYNE